MALEASHQNFTGHKSSCWLPKKKAGATGSLCCHRARHLETNSDCLWWSFRSKVTEWGRSGSSTVFSHHLCWTQLEAEGGRLGVPTLLPVDWVGAPPSPSSRLWLPGMSREGLPEAFQERQWPEASAPETCPHPTPFPRLHP